MVDILYATGAGLSPYAWFSLQFLWHPPPGFTVDLDRIDAGTPVIPDDEFCWDPPDPGDHSYWAGVLVTRRPAARGVAAGRRGQQPRHAAGPVAGLTVRWLTAPSISMLLQIR